MDVQHDIFHELDSQQASNVARKAVDAYRERFAKYNFQSRWTGDQTAILSFEVMGKRLEGSMSVLSDRLRFELEVPLMFKVFSSQAIAIVDREAQVWIQKAKAGELNDGGQA